MIILCEFCFGLSYSKNNKKTFAREIKREFERFNQDFSAFGLYKTEKSCRKIFLVRKKK